ncbi:protein phosphatase 1 regulatory subunit 14C [Kryptolebias marmoratus]|uniref:protein phosphatase 1 regulatory subunit 14C n=1 Tax=Kryptolebias marmoratus TaxID=37003 RepID=UPI0007F88828|nr:protein phosphatase 1 regulatory subunit 14C [Kryptolebias marmoratus]
MSAASTKTSASPLPSDNSHVFFQVAPPVVNCERSAPPIEKKQGKVTVRYDRKELRKRLELEEWIVDSLADLYDCEEDEMPSVEIDIDYLMEFNSTEERTKILQESLQCCYKPTEHFIDALLFKLRGMTKLEASKKSL